MFRTRKNFISILVYVLNSEFATQTAKTYRIKDLGPPKPGAILVVGLERFDALSSHVIELDDGVPLLQNGEDLL